MMRAGLAGWPLWISVGVHVIGLATASSRSLRWRATSPSACWSPVEMVRVEPPPPEPPKPPRVIPRSNPVVRSAPITQTLMQPDPLPQPTRPEPVLTAPDRRYLASANVPGPALAVPGDAGAGGLLLPAPEIPGAAPGARVDTGVARGTARASRRSPARWAAIRPPPTTRRARDAKASRAS